MKKPIRKLAYLGLAVLTLSACSQTFDRTFVDYPNIENGGELYVSDETFTEADLFVLLDPNNTAEKAYKTSAPSKNWDKLDNQTKLTLSIQSFIQGKTASQLVQNRNLVQDRLFLESDRLCAQFVKIMNNGQSTANLALKSLSGLSGVIGGIVGGSSSQWFSGAAGVFSHADTQFDAQNFHKTATQTIVSGIEHKRETLKDQILGARTNKSHDQYSIVQAIDDVVLYHASCHVLAGLRQASEAIHQIKTPQNQGS